MKIIVYCSVEDKIKHMEAKIMTLVEESCMLSARPDPDDETSVKREHDLGKVPIMGTIMGWIDRKYCSSVLSRALGILISYMYL